MLISPSQIVSNYAQYLPPMHAALLGGMVLGVSPEKTSALYTSMKGSGLLHLMVLSGSNITFLIGVMYVLFGKISKWISLMLTGFLIVLFMFFVGLEAPVMRAVVTALITLVYLIDGRRVHALYATFASFVIICLYDMQTAVSVSSQLSYAATIGILVFYKPIIYRGSHISLKIMYAFCNELLISLSVMVPILPILYYTFGVVQFQGVLATALVSPVVGIIMILGSVLSLATFVSETLSHALATSVLPFLSWILYVSSIFST